MRHSLRTFAALLLITVVVWFTYAKVGESQFVLLDDDLHITHNPHLQAGASLGGLWKQPYQGLYIPVTYMVWAAQKALFDRYWGTWGGETTGPLRREASARFYHRTNGLLHWANTLLVFFILMELAGCHWAAIAGALLFSLHPVQVEPVAWISGLKDVLSGFFALLALLGYLKGSGLRASEKKSGWLYAGASIAFLLALFSKPSSVVVPAIALALDCLGRGTPWRCALRRLGPWIAAAVPLAWLAKISQPSIHITFVTPWILRPSVAADALTFYFSKVLLPLGLELLDTE